VVTLKIGMKIVLIDRNFVHQIICCFSFIEVNTKDAIFITTE